MALSMLVGGAECGPSNPLQGLAKRFDQDRGIQQDHFGTPRPGSSREAFRTQHSTAAPDQDAARFFSQGPTSAPPVRLDAPYDLSALHAALPLQPATPVSLTTLAQQPSVASSWAADFTSRQQTFVPSPVTSRNKVNSHASSSFAPPTSEAMLSRGHMQWNRPFSTYGIGQVPLQTHPQPATVQTSQIAWETVFRDHEEEMTASQHIHPNTETVRSGPVDQDELARTAGLLLDNIKDEQNPKFKNSQFLSLMQQLRDRDVVVEGNQMVKNDRQIPSTSVDVKGKGKAVDMPGLARVLPGMPLQSLAEVARQHLNIERDAEGDPNLAYFEQENADYAAYWENAINARQQDGNVRGHSEWDTLQDSWDQFEATTAGVKPISLYQFQDNNPYLQRDDAQTHHHLMHGGEYLSLSESVLQLEAAVQRDMTNATAWFELGVKQQENEREAKALQALQRAVELDPTHLPSWLALAISHTNENNRTGTYDAIREWVNRNDRYRSTSLQYPENPKGSTTERYAQLTECLIQMVRSNASGEIDADVQIALAVLLNSGDDYEKAQDCFRTALAVRPRDWLLYNRVGATMANNGQAEGALEFYYRALELNPGYIRARYNLGISCINLRRYEEAAHHIFDALVLQDNDGIKDNSGLNEKRGVTSKALWDSLKTTCMHMYRINLATICDRQDLEAFKNAFYPEM